MNAAQYRDRTKQLEELLKKMTERGVLSKDDQIELDRISDEVADYEETRYPFEVESLIEMIELRMYQRKLKQRDLAEILGISPSRISEILNGKRGLTLEIAKGLFHKLNIDAELILSEGGI